MWRIVASVPSGSSASSTLVASKYSLDSDADFGATRRVPPPSDRLQACRGAYEVWQLKGLCRRLKAPPELEADPWEGLGSIVREVAKRLSERGVLDTRGYGAARGPRSYRRYGTLSGHVNWFVRYNEEYAVRFEESLLWIGGPSGDMRPRESLS
jgi:hypothetical protein